MAMRPGIKGTTQDSAVQQTRPAHHERPNPTHYRALLELRRVVYGDAIDRWANEGGAIGRGCNLVRSA
jgi:hypothetical protein